MFAKKKVLPILILLLFPILHTNVLAFGADDDGETSTNEGEIVAESASSASSSSTSIDQQTLNDQIQKQPNEQENEITIHGDHGWDVLNEQDYEFAEQVMTQYGKPATISRTVKKVKLDAKGRRKKRDLGDAIAGDGLLLLRSEDNAMQSMLKMLDSVWTEEAKQTVAQLDLPEEGCFVSFSVKKDINAQAYLFDVGTSMPPENLEKWEILEESESERKRIRQKQEKGADDGDDARKSQQPKKGELRMDGQQPRRRVGPGPVIVQQDEVIDAAKNVAEAEAPSAPANGAGTAVEKPGESQTEIVAEEEEIVSKRADGEETMKKVEKKVDEEMAEKSVAKKEEKKVEEEEESFEEEPETVKLGTYALLRVLQKGRLGLGTEPSLALSNLPTDVTFQQEQVKREVTFLLDQIIDACDGKMDAAVDEDIIESSEDDKVEKALKLEEALERVHEQDGKMESEEDEAILSAEVRGLVRQLVRGIKQAKNADREEIREKAKRRKEEIELQAKLDPKRREQLSKKRINAYNFLKTVRFDISGRPAHRLFSKLGTEHFEELKRLYLRNEQVEQLELSPLQIEAADSLLYAKKRWYRHTAEFVWKEAFNLGKSVVNGVVWLFRKIKIMPPREVTSGERAEQLRKADQEQQKLDEKRKAVLREAVSLFTEKSSNCLRLKSPIMDAIYGSHIDPHKTAIMEDMRARLGAQALNSVINTKIYPEGHRTAVGMSVIGSGIIAILLDVLMIPLVITQLSGVLGPIPFVGITLLLIIRGFLKPALESLTPMGVETFDSAVIKLYLDSLKGKKFWRGIKHFQHTLKGAVAAGKIAAAGSIFFNFSMLLGHWALPAQLIFNILSAVTSAAQIPIELAKTRDTTMLGLHQQMEAGFLAKLTAQETADLVKEMRAAELKSKLPFWRRLAGMPQQQEKTAGQKQQQVVKQNPDDKLVEHRDAYIQWVERETWRMMEVERSSRLAINSMGVGPIASTIVFMLMQGFSAGVPKAPEELTNAITVMFNAPTEMISLTGAIWGANHVGIQSMPWLLSNDEQKNAQMLGLIFEKSHSLLNEHKKNEVAATINLAPAAAAISNEEIHCIYNPRLNTMGIGRFFVHKGILLMKKWDQWQRKNEGRMRPPLLESYGNKKQKLLVTNWEQDVVYLITFPRLSAAQGLSPKALGLELWLRMEKQVSRLHFRRVADGLFLRHLFNKETENEKHFPVPYVEFNGKKITGNLHKIVADLSKARSDRMQQGNGQANVKEFFVKAATQQQQKHINLLQIYLEQQRLTDQAMGFMITDRGLITEMISTMSQLYPRLVDYEIEHVESWDMLPWQLKRIFNSMTESLEQKLKAEKGMLKEILHVERVKGLARKIESDLMKAGEGKYLFGDKPTSADVLLFGILVQFFETPLIDPAIQQHFDSVKENVNNPLYKFYQRMIRDFLGREKWHALKAEPWPLNYDFVANIAGTEKYKGEFHVNRGSELEFKAIKTVIEQPEPDLTAIEKSINDEKVAHPILRSFWKVKKQWTPAVFAKERSERTEKKKREMYREDIGAKLLVHSPPVLSVIVENLLDLVWDWTWLKQEFKVTDENVTDLEKAGQQLGVLINQAVDKHMTVRGDRLVEQAAGIQLVQEFILQDKAGEICEQKWTQAAFSVVDKFYGEQTKEEVAKLLGVNLVSKEEEEENVVENDARTSGGDKEEDEEEKTPLLTSLLKDEQKAAKSEEETAAILKAISGEKSTTVRSLVARVNHYVFNRKVSAHIHTALLALRDSNIEATVLNQLNLRTSLQRRGEGKVEQKDQADQQKDQVDQQKDQVDQQKDQVDQQKDQVDQQKDQVDQQKDQVDQQKDQVDQQKDQVDQQKDQADQQKDQADQQKDQADQQKDQADQQKDQVNQHVILNWYNMFMGPHMRIYECVRKVFNRQNQADALQSIESSYKRIGRDHARRALVNRLGRAFDRMTGIKKALQKSCEKTADWHLLQDRIRLIPNNSKWISDLKAAKERLIKNVKIVEKNRKQKIKQIQRIHLLNGQMSELVKARIDEINGRRRVKAQIAAALSVEKVEKFRQFVRYQFKVGQQSSNEPVYNVQRQKVNHVRVLANIESYLDTNVGLLATGVLPMLHEIMVEGVVEKHFLAALDTIAQNYRHIAFQTQYFYPNVRPKVFERLSQMEKVLKDSKHEIEKAKLFVSTKAGGLQLILDQINGINDKLIKDNVGPLPLFKWMWPMNNEQVREKKAALTQLVKNLRAVEPLGKGTIFDDEGHEISANFLREAMDKIRRTHLNAKRALHAKVGDQLKSLVKNYGEQICAEDLAATLMDSNKFEALKAFTEFKAMCAHKSKDWVLKEVETHTEPGPSRNFLLKQIDTFYKENFAQIQNEKMQRAKYPIAKSLLHLMAAYLCEDKHQPNPTQQQPQPSSGDGKSAATTNICGKEHKEMAKLELQKLSPKFDDDDVKKMFAEVKTVVYHSIVDYNENFVIREEILRQYGLPLSVEIEKAENSVSHFDRDSFVEALTDKNRAQLADEHQQAD